MNRKEELCRERANMVNNIRMLYIRLYDSKRIVNVKDFAEKIGVGKSTAEGWLREAYAPLPNYRKKIEIAFGLNEGCLKNESCPTIPNWSEEYYKRNGAKPSLRKSQYEIDEETSKIVAEDDIDIISRILSYNKEELRELLQNIRKELTEHISKSNLRDCPRLLEIGFGY